MHIPAWAAALRELCRVLKPGGWLCIFETNCRSLEAALVLRLRGLGGRQPKSTVIAGNGGLEFWSGTQEAPYLVRYSNPLAIRDELAASGVRVLLTFSSEFWDVNRFPPQMRPLVRSFNIAWTTCCPSVTRLSSGVALVGQKTATPTIS